MCNSTRATTKTTTKLSTRNLISMAKKTFESTFRKSIYILQRAANREIDLDYDYPKVYRKVRKFYESNGVEFYNEPEADYEMILSLISDDLQVNVPA